MEKLRTCEDRGAPNDLQTMHFARKCPRTKVIASDEGHKPVSPRVASNCPASRLLAAEQEEIRNTRGAKIAGLACHDKVVRINGRAKRWAGEIT